VSRTIKRVLFAGPWWHEDLMQGVARHAGRRGWHLNLEPALSGQLPDDWRGDGLITTLGGDMGAFERFRRRAACPAVSLSLNHPEVAIPRVGFDNAAAGRMAAEHLLQRGFTSFAFYDRAGQYSGQRRRAAFADALAEAGHDHDPVLSLAIAPRISDSQPGQWVARQQMLTQELQQAPKPLAVFAADDSSAVEVVEACQSIGLDIPHQVGVLGMLDMPLFRESTTVPISSITVDFDTNTRVACELLESMMAGGPAPDRPIVFAPTGIATRASTDVIAARHPGVARAIRFMMEQYAQPIGVPDIVGASGMSQTRLFAAFKQDVGQPPAAVLTRIRLDKARRQLAQTHDKIEVVAEACGFGNRINLYRQFKQRLGLSPGAFRRRARQDRSPSTD
jgi:LacI family transcriptional regulator